MGNIFRERTIVVAVIIQVLVAGFSSFLSIGLAALYDPSSIPGDTAITVGINGTHEVNEYLENAGLRVRVFEDAQAALNAFHRGGVETVLVPLPSSGDSDVVRLDVWVPDGELVSTFSLVRVREALQDYERDLQDEREHRLEMRPLYLETDARPGSWEFLHTILIPLLLFLPAALAGALVSDTLTEEVQRGTLPLLLTTPATLRSVVHGKVMGNLVLVPLLAYAWFGLLRLNGVEVGGLAMFEATVLVTAAALVFSVQSVIITLATRDRNQAQFLYALAFLFVIGASLLMPQSPVNALVLMLGGSSTPATHATTALIVAGAVGLYLGLLEVVRRWGVRLLKV